MSDILTLGDAAQRSYKRGNNAFYAGDIPKAVYYLRRAVSADGENVRYIVDLISVLNQAGMYEDSFSYGARGLALELNDTDRSIILFHMGEACYCLGLNEPSKRYIKASLEAAPEGPFAADAAVYGAELEKCADTQENSGWTDAEGTDGPDGQMQDADGSRFGEQSLLFEAAAAQVSGDYEAVYRIASQLLQEDPSCIEAMLLGYTAASAQKNRFGIKRFAACLRSIRDCSDAEMMSLCRFFETASQDKLACDVFASLYRENTFWIQACFALAAAFYNTGQRDAAINMLERVNLLEGGGGLGALCLEDLRLTEPPEKMRYLFAPTAEQADILFNRLQSLLEEPSDTSEYAFLLESNLKLGLNYCSLRDTSDLMGHLRPELQVQQRVIGHLLLDYSLLPEKKLLLALTLKHTVPGIQCGVSVLGDIVSIEDIAKRFRMRNFNVPSYLEECFGSDEVESVYMQLPGSGILSYDAPDEDYAFAAHMILMFWERFAHHADGEAGAEGSVQENFGRGVEMPDGDFSDFLTSNDEALLRVSGYYGIEPEHAREIMKQLFRKGILYTDEDASDKKQ